MAAIDMDTQVIVANDADKSMNNLLKFTDQVLDRYYPLQKLTRKEFKQTKKPWITGGILKSIKRKDELFHKYIKCKPQLTKWRYTRNIRC